MLSGKATRLKRLVSSLRSRPFWCVFRLCFLKKGTQPRKLRKLILPAVKRGNDGGVGGGGGWKEDILNYASRILQC